MNKLSASCEIWVSHSGIAEDWGPLGCDAVSVGEWCSAF